MNPQYVLPCRKVLSYWIIPEKYEAAATELKTVLGQTQNIAITSEMWTSDSNIAYISVTSHFIFNEEMRSQVLSTKEIAGSHNVGKMLITQ